MRDADSAHGTAEPDRDELDRLLDAVIAGDPATPRDGAHLAAARRVRELADEQLPTATRDRHLLHIRHAAAIRPTGQRGPRPRRSLRSWLPRRLAPITVGALAFVMLAGGGTVAAAQAAAPDHPLYGVKRTSEQVWTALPLGAAHVANAHLTLAERRLGEAR